MITKQLKDAWLKELRDPTNKQHFDAYFKYNVIDGGPFITDKKCMCATGALLKVLEATNILETPVAIIGGEAFEYLIAMNDIQKKPFAEIADWIEKNIEATP